ncbi:hypothetical protein H6F61_01155 [Cyanobacteria bacterium FACHB-472]|nr:hypothetical protein [Cyanobacteria bacterium FACHB-472]
MGNQPDLISTTTTSALFPNPQSPVPSPQPPIPTLIYGFPIGICCIPEVTLLECLVNRQQVAFEGNS